MQQILALLDDFRSRDADLIADIEAAIRTLPEPNGMTAKDALDASPNLRSMLYHNGSEADDFVQSTEETWKPRHYHRLVDEMARVPEGASYRKLRAIYDTVAHWVVADVALEDPTKARSIFG